VEQRTDEVQLEKPRVKTVTQAGQILGIGRSAAYAAAKRGEIPTVKIGRRIVVPIAALERLLQESA
jgi:excisionase family DNA binding protein